MAQFTLGALGQSLYNLIEFDDEQEARKCIELADKQELHEIVQHLNKTLSIINTVLKDETFGGATKTLLARNALSKLTDDERADLFAEFCGHCGAKDPRCRCWDDT